MKAIAVPLAALALACALTQPAEAAPENNLSDYFDHNEISVFLCGQGYLNDGVARFRACKAETEAEAGKLYKAHAARLRTASAKGALKAYYAQFLSALDGSLPEAGETNLQYRARQNANTQKLKDMAAKVRVENLP